MTDIPTTIPGDTPDTPPVPQAVARHSGPLNMRQLHSLLGGTGFRVDGDPTQGDQTIVVDNWDQAALDAVMASYVYDANWGVPQSHQTLSGLIAKAQQVRAGTGTFTAAQVQQIIAALVLRLTNEE